MTNLFSLVGKVAVVTGASGAIGSAMVKGLAAAGAHVALLNRKVDVMDRVAQEINASGGRAISVYADVLSEASLHQAHEKISMSLGLVDVLVNCAGGNQPGATIPSDGSFFDINIDALRSVTDLNFIGTLLPIKVLAKDMLSQKCGCIINISSMSAYRPLTRVAGYSASKAAVSNFTQWLATEFALKYGEGIRVNAIAPGFILTEQNRELLTTEKGTLSERGHQIVSHTPFGRLGTPDELVGTLIWLCSDASKFVTGIVVPVDGGFSAYAGV